MGLYTYSKKELKFKSLLSTNDIIITFLVLIGFLLRSIYMPIEIEGDKVTVKTEDRIFIIEEGEDVFTPKKLERMLEDLNVLHPEIVIAQSKIETGNYTSNIFIENNNLFGMKEAVVRAHTAKGTQYGHAYYKNWRESVYDYALYQSSYLFGLKTRGQYLSYISKSYAQDPTYTNKIKKILKDIGDGD